MLDPLHVLEQRGPASKSIGAPGGAAPPPAGAAPPLWRVRAAPALAMWPASSVGWCRSPCPGRALKGRIGCSPAIREKSRPCHFPRDRRPAGGRRGVRGGPDRGGRSRARAGAHGADDPQEAGDLVARTVSFTKGLLHGTGAGGAYRRPRSNTPRRLRGLVLRGHASARDGEHGSTRPGAAGMGGAPIMQGEQTVGEVTSAALVARPRGSRCPRLPEARSRRPGRRDGGHWCRRRRREREAAHAVVRELPLASLQAAGEPF